MTKQLAVVIGRFAPTHTAHVSRLLERALEENDHVFVLFGSSLKARDPKNPFTWQERQEMMMHALRDSLSSEREFYTFYQKISFAPIKDYPYSDNRWCLQIQKLVADKLETLEGNWKVNLVGNDKDESSYYLKLFPQWDAQVTEHKATEDFAGATTIRNALFEDDLDTVRRWCVPAVVSWLERWLETPQGQWLQEEYLWNKQYQMVLARPRRIHPMNAPEQLRLAASDIEASMDPSIAIAGRGVNTYQPTSYKPIYHTCDNVVVWRGHVLLVERRARPGKGLWALPGGFLNPDEWIHEGALREGEEESRVRIYPPGTDIEQMKADIAAGKRVRYHGPLKLSRAWQGARRTFDNPTRSLRGRIITDAFLWEIPDEFEVDVTAGDDAAKAQWFTLHEILNGPMDYKLFEDHQAIIAHMVL